MHDHDAIQRLLNEAKKAELSERFGAVFHSCTPDIPPQIESAWLRHVEEFELRCRGAETTTVRRYVGSPPVRPVGAIPVAELEAELSCLLEILESNNVRIEFGRPLSPAEKYRFVTEELLDREIENIRMDGLVLNFLYDEFHPDDAREATMIGEDFFFAFFNREETILSNILGFNNIALASAGPPDPGAFRSRLSEALTEFITYTDWDATVTACVVEQDLATISAFLRWTGLQRGSGKTFTRTGTALLRLRKVHTLWYIIDAEIPGILSLTS
jgi:hypothetical protein